MYLGLDRAAGGLSLLLVGTVEATSSMTGGGRGGRAGEDGDSSSAGAAASVLFSSRLRLVVTMVRVEIEGRVSEECERRERRQSTTVAYLVQRGAECREVQSRL